MRKLASPLHGERPSIGKDANTQITIIPAFKMPDRTIGSLLLIEYYTIHNKVYDRIYKELKEVVVGSSERNSGGLKHGEYETEGNIYILRRFDLRANVSQSN